jgi:hypothetical protein
MSICMSLFTSFIKQQKPFCINCVHYIKNNYPYVKLYDDQIGMCYLFGQKNIVGKMDYEDILTCRLNQSKCGVKARFYKQKLN